MPNEFKAKNGVITPVIQVSSAGSAGAPSITKSDDLNTGIFFPAADTIAFAEGGAEVVRIASSGNVLINTTTDSGFKLEVNGSFAATTKSFVIDHPTKPDKKLRYGSLEGPENGVYVRGKLNGRNVIELPEYWTKLVDPNSITVHLTPVGKIQNLYVQAVKDNKVFISGKSPQGFYIVYAERCDVEKLVVEV